MSASHVELPNAFYAPTLLPAIEELLSRGVGAQALEACFRRSLLELRTPLVRVPLFLSRRFWALAEVASGDPAIGLQAARHFASSLTNGLTYLFDVAPTLESACAHFAEYFPYFNGSLCVELHRRDGRVMLSLRERGALRSGRQSREYTVVGICSLLRRKLLASGITQDPLLRIDLPGAAPVNDEPYAQALRAPLQWGAPDMVLHLDAALFGRVLAPHNAMLEGTLVGLLDQARAQTQRTLLDDAADYIARELPGGASFQSFCEGRHLTERTAARRLLSHGWRYSELLDEQRRYLAVDLLEDARLGLAQITDQLGYGDLQSFSRAFSRWYGTSPGAWRDALPG